MIRLQIQDIPSGWYVHIHPSDKFNLDQEYTFKNKREGLQKAKDLLDQWLMELEDC